MDFASLPETLDSREQDLLVTALTVLESNHNIKARLLDQGSRLTSHAVSVTFEVGNARYDYQVECKKYVDRKNILLHVNHELKEKSPHSLFITTYLSAELADFCKEIGLQFIDLAGNAYIAAPGFYVFVKGQKGGDNQTQSLNKRSVGTVAALKMNFALLCNPQLVNASYRDIAKQANIYLGAVGTILDDLAQRGLLLKTTQKNKRRLIDPQRLSEEWVINYPAILRPKLNARRFSAENPTWWNEVKFDRQGAVWSGEVAAHKITHYLKPATQTLYIAPNEMKRTLNELITQHQLKLDMNGPVEILEQFWVQRDGSSPEQLAPNLLIYADLMASHDPRNGEVAKLIKEKLIERI